MNCKRAQDNLSRLVDGDLSGRQATLLMAHLQGCEQCMAEYHAISNTKKLIRSVVVPAPSAATKSRVFARFERAVLGESRQTPPSTKAAYWRPFSSAFTSGLLGLAVGLAFFMPHNKTMSVKTPSSERVLLKYALDASKTAGAVLGDGLMIKHSPKRAS